MQAPRNFTPMMRSQFKRAALLSMVAAASLAALTGGCKRDVEKADEALSSDISAANNSLADKPDGSAAIGRLSKSLSTNSMASAAEKAQANFAEGQAEVRAADATLMDLDAAQNHLARLIGRVADMTTRMQANNVTLAGLAAKEPTKSLAVIDKTTTAAKAGDQGVWYAGDAAPIPALAAVDKNVADLTARLDTLKAKHAALEKGRADALTQAEKLSSQSEQARGKASVDFYTRASNLRKAAALLSIQMQTNEADAAQANRELAVAAAQKTQIQAALGKFDEQSKQVTAGWDGVKKQIADVAARTTSIVDGDESAAPATGPSTNTSEPAVNSLTSAGDQITQVSGEIEKLRADAKAHLDKADHLFAEAARLSKDVSGKFNTLISNPDLRESGGRQGWQWMVEIFNDADPTLRRAQVQQRIARLNADAFFYTSSKLAAFKAVGAVLNPADPAVKAALDQAKAAAPKSFDPGTLDADVAADKVAAEAAFKQSDGMLADAIKAADGTDIGLSLSRAAQVTRMVELYGHWAFAVAADDKAADTYKSKASELAASLTQGAGADLPLPLPPEIAPAPLSSVTSGAPTTASSATGPSTTAPAGESTLDASQDQKDVRAALIAFFNAMLDGDDVKAKTMIIPDRQNENEVDTIVAMMKSVQTLTDSLRTKLPAQPMLVTIMGALKASMSQAMLAKEATVAIKVNGDVATISAGPGDSSTMKKVDGAWKLAPDGGGGDHSEQLKPIKTMTSAFDSLSADVLAGRISTAAEIGLRLKAAAQMASGQASATGLAVPAATQPSDSTSPPAPTSAPAAP